MATNVVTCDSLGGLILEWLSRENADPESKVIEVIRKLLRLGKVKLDFITKPDSSSPTGNKYYITITQTNPDGSETTDEIPLDQLVNEILNQDKYVTGGSESHNTDGNNEVTEAKITLQRSNGLPDVVIDLQSLINALKNQDKYVTGGSESHNTDANGGVTNTKITLQRSNGLPDVVIDLQSLINALKKDIKDNQDKYVNGGTLTVTNDSNGKPNGGNITLTVKNGDPVTINIKDLIDKLKAYADGEDSFLEGVDKLIKQGANGKFESIQLKFNVKGKDPILVDLTDLIDAQIDARKVTLNRYYPTVMFNRGKIDGCTRFSTERIGWVYHKDDLRPADADVEMIDESTPYNILGYAYGTSTTDHNIPIQYTEPDGDVVTVGYAANSPLMLVEE